MAQTEHHIIRIKAIVKALKAMGMDRDEDFEIVRDQMDEDRPVEIKVFGFSEMNLRRRQWNTSLINEYLLENGHKFKVSIETDGFLAIVRPDGEPEAQPERDVSATGVRSAATITKQFRVADAPETDGMFPELVTVTYRYTPRTEGLWTIHEWQPIDIVIDDTEMMRYIVPSEDSAWLDKLVQDNRPAGDVSF